MEGMEFVLNNNVCKSPKSDGTITYVLPNYGTALGPCHVPNHVDIFESFLDNQIKDESPVNLIHSFSYNQIKIP